MAGKEEKASRSSAARKGRIVVYSNSGQPTISTGQGFFVSKKFSSTSVSNIESYLREQLVECRKLDRIFIPIVQIYDATAPMMTDLCQQIPKLPRQLIEYVKAQDTDSHNVAIMPYYHAKNQGADQSPTRNRRRCANTDQRSAFPILISVELVYLLSHPYGVPSSPNHPVGAVMGFDSTEIRFRSIATWICPSSILSIPENEATPMILLLVANADVPARLEKHLGSPENSWRMTRIQNSPSWIYLDLAHVLGHWSDVWLRVQRTLIYRDAQTHGKIQGPPVLQFTRQLHRDNANIIVLQENLRLHIAALERFEQFVKRSQQWEPKLVAEDHQDELNERIENLLGSLRNYQETSNVVLQQWKTLLSLAFNTETVSQGQAVARLNTLAFAFIPLSFASSLFAIPGFPAPIQWYPLWAFVTFIVAIAAAYISRKIRISKFNSRSWRKWRLARFGPVGDEESQTNDSSSHSPHAGGGQQHIAVNLHDALDTNKKSQLENEERKSSDEAEGSPAEADTAVDRDLANSLKASPPGDIQPLRKGDTVVPSSSMTLMSDPTYSLPNGAIGFSPTPHGSKPAAEYHGDTSPIPTDGVSIFERIESPKPKEVTDSKIQANSGYNGVSAAPFLQLIRHDLWNSTKIMSSITTLLPFGIATGQKADEAPNGKLPNLPNDVNVGEPQVNSIYYRKQMAKNDPFSRLISVPNFFSAVRPNDAPKALDNYDKDLVYGDYYPVQDSGRKNKLESKESVIEEKRKSKGKKKESNTNWFIIPKDISTRTDRRMGKESGYAAHFRRGAGYQQQSIFSRVTQAFL